MDVLKAVFYVSTHNDIYEKTSRSAEWEIMHAEDVPGTRKWIIREVIRLNKEFCDGRLVGYIHKDDDNEVEEILVSLWETGIQCAALLTT